MENNNRTCENCTWWQDYEKRVWAIISDFTSDRAGNHVELRLCKYLPPPTVVDNNTIYTDKDYCCSEFHRKSKDD